MAWAMDAAKNQHAQAIAQATQQAEEAQRTGSGPKPMMVTPYKHNWIIAGAADAELEKRYDSTLLHSHPLVEYLTGKV